MDIRGEPAAGEEIEMDENSSRENRRQEAGKDGNEDAPSLRTPDLLLALETVDRDANAVAESFTSLVSSLRSALSQVTSSSVEHMRCYNDVAGQLQESALDAASKGNRFINACLRLNEEMQGMGTFSAQLKLLRRTVDNLDSLMNRYLPRT